MFRQNRNKLSIIEYRGGVVKPSQGRLTLYWWKKGNSIDGFYYKADLYGHDGVLLVSGIIDETYDGLISYVKEQIGIN